MTQKKDRAAKSSSESHVQSPNSLLNVPLASSTRLFAPMLSDQSHCAKSKYSQKFDRFFFRHWFGSALAALVRHTAVVEKAIEAGAQILVAAGADITAAGLTVDCPFRTAVVAMPVHRSYPPTAWPSAGLGIALTSLAWPSAWRIFSAVLAPVRPCFSRR